ncbi:Beta-galactosidase-1-like protein [Desmophyllum pertusum]|uniref:Beta-galactosidase-1-like protein n=1 Tax=Desmophyllum pertusum TaxID=174260 RepID=A0A9W9Z898_9CNID|nr:Beta-galactosidase-1-like protein [Desmophyllum pertusum]
MGPGSVFLLFLTAFCSLQNSDSAKSFTIDFENNCFLKDGVPFRYISGSFHYFRVPRFCWKDRLTKMKAGGLNTVQIYIAWNIHEPVQGEYNFDGDADIVSFIELANSLGLLVVVRAGPFICAEWDFGGFPAWLLNDTSIVLRSSKDRRYLDAVDSWMAVALPKLQPLLYINGGPIISVQVENEYGSSLVCDHDYMTNLEQLFRKHLGEDVILFTVDSDWQFLFACGTIPSLYATVDFGPETDPESAFAVMRKFTPKGPLVNSEFYTGWIDHWGEKHQTKDAAMVAKSLDKILSMNASVNFYMYEGGTNFGFMNGANYNLILYKPIPTSYDYDAPLTEAGDTGTKFHVLRETISKHEKIL